MSAPDLGKPDVGDRRNGRSIEPDLWRPSLLGRILTGSPAWSLALDDEQFLLSTSTKLQQLVLVSEQAIQVKRGLFWSRILVSTNAGSVSVFGGLPKSLAASLSAKIGAVQRELRTRGDVSRIRHEHQLVRDWIAEKITAFLKATDPFQKTIVFCDDIDHAERMRQALVNLNPQRIQENRKYVMRITGDEQEGKTELDNFINPEERYPVIATTSKLMTTGVDAQTCKLVVLDQHIKSMTEFKQIIGRGTRINEDYGKFWFTIMDFKKATELFADPAFDGDPVQVYEPKGDEPPVPPDDVSEQPEGGEPHGGGEGMPPDDGGDTGGGGTGGGRIKYVVGNVAVFVVAERVQYYGADGKLITESLADIKGGEICLDDPRTLTLARSTVEKYELSAGDVLVIRVNGSADLVGRFIVCRNGPQAIPCDHFIRMRFRAGLVDAGYLKLVGDSSCSRSAIAGLFVSTAGQKTVNQGHIGSLRVPLPPIDEQQGIVAKVDELMALCDRLEVEQADAEAAHAELVEALLASLTQARDAADFRASWQQLAEHFHTLFTTEASVDALKQTVMQLGVMGRLVPQLASDEPASASLDRANRARQLHSKPGRSPRSSPSAEISDDEMLFDLPAGWVWTRKGNVLQFLTGYAFKSEWFKPEGTRLLRNVNIGHGSIDWKECASIHPDQAAEFGDFELQANDLVLTLDRPIISTGLKVAIVKEADLPCLLLQRVARISAFANCVSTSYLFIWLNSKFFTGSIDPGRSNGVPHISTTQVAKMPFALPPLAEQERIVAKVDELLNLCDQLKLDLTQSRKHHEHLASALVERAAA